MLCVGMSMLECVWVQLLQSEFVQLNVGKMCVACQFHLRHLSWPLICMQLVKVHHVCAILGGSIEQVSKTKCHFM